MWRPVQIYSCCWFVDLQVHCGLTSTCCRWYVLDAESTDLVAIHTDGNEQLSVMRFSVGRWSQSKSSSNGELKGAEPCERSVCYF